MRLVIVCVALVVLGFWDPHTCSDFRSHYGKPILEQFAASENISLRVSYGFDHRVCRLTLAPAHSQFAPETWLDPEQFMAPAEAEQVLEQVAPPESRGERVRT